MLAELGGKSPTNFETAPLAISYTVQTLNACVCLSGLSSTLVRLLFIEEVFGSAFGKRCFGLSPHFCTMSNFVKGCTIINWRQFLSRSNALISGDWRCWCLESQGADEIHQTRTNRVDVGRSNVFLHKSNRWRYMLDDLSRRCDCGLGRRLFFFVKLLGSTFGHGCLGFSIEL